MPDSTEIPSTVKFHYIKSNHFRTVHADGAIGGISPRGEIHMALFTERNPIPQEMVYEVLQNPDSSIQLGQENAEKRVTKEGLIREVEVQVNLNLEMARTLQIWLADHISKLETVVKK